MSYPQCLEIHRCGGCCQEAQFSCVSIRQEPVTFSPVNKKSNETLCFSFYRENIFLFSCS